MGASCVDSQFGLPASCSVCCDCTYSLITAKAVSLECHSPGIRSPSLVYCVFRTPLYTDSYYPWSAPLYVRNPVTNVSTPTDFGHGLITFSFLVCGLSS